MSTGTIARVSGPMVEVEGLEGVAMLELVAVGDKRLPGEVIALEGNRATVQVYAHTGGVRPGAPAQRSGAPLMAELGPGLLGGVFDGMLRRLADASAFLDDSATVSTLPRDRAWPFTPTATEGSDLGGGEVLGTVPETTAIEFRALVPPDVSGRLEWLAAPGDYTVEERIALVGATELTLAHLWPVRRPRPVAERLDGAPPLITGQRVLDLLFPVARGSTASVPGGFGTGKTVLLQQIAKWCNADVIVYVGCGERGNEMADVLADIAQLEDPRTGESLLGRTVLVANTSNMPVMARESSIHTGATVAEFFRDMGYDVALIADSTSRWAEALREIASRTGQLPAEEGYPAGLASALAAFYERSGRVRTLAGDIASLTTLGAVSPPGGDMTEPVTAHTRRFVRATWSLDRDLAYARHYPAVSWNDSSSRDAQALGRWHADNGTAEWSQLRSRALKVLAEAERLQAIADLVGAASLPDRERVTLLGARLIRDAVLSQSALSPNDAYSSIEKQVALLRLSLRLLDAGLELVERGIPAARIEEFDFSEAVRVKDSVAPDEAESVSEIADRLVRRLEALA